MPIIYSKSVIIAAVRGRRQLSVLICTGKAAYTVVNTLTALIVKIRIESLYTPDIFRVVAAVVFDLAHHCINSAFDIPAHRAEAVFLIAEIALRI